MKTLILASALATAALLIAGCKEEVASTNNKSVYRSYKVPGVDIYEFCDQYGNRVYVTYIKEGLAVIPGDCTNKP